MAERITPLVAEEGIELCRVKMEGGSLGGYRWILTENLSERERTIYKCLRCEGIMKDCSTTEKGEQMCACCLREKEESHSNSNAPIRITILSLKCSCPQFKRGCDWLGKLGNVEDHLAACLYVYVSCELMCGAVLTSGEMRRHVREECTQREEACLHCSRIYEVCEMAEHVEVCGKVEVMCELGCGRRVHREDTLYHRQSECSEETVLCPYVKYGCEVMGLNRRELKQHLEENRCFHTEMKLNTLEEQTELKLKVLEEQTKIKLNELTNDNKFLQNQIDCLENRLLAKDREIDFLSEENRLKQEGIVKWNIKNILKIFKPNLKLFNLGSNGSKEFTIAMYQFRLHYHTNSPDYFSIYLSPSKSSNHDNLDWPLRVVTSTQVICHRNNIYSMEFTPPLEEIQKEDCGMLSSKLIVLCSIPFSTDLEDFIKSDSLDLEVTIRILKNTTFQSV